MTDDTPATAAVRAALETAHWYSVDRTGRATQCVDAQDAHDNAACNARDWPAVAPHRAMQLIDAAPVAAMLAELDRLRYETDAKRDQIVRLMADIDALGAALLKAERERDRLRDDRDCEKRLRKDAEEVREDAIEQRDRLAAEVAEHQHAAQIIDAELGCQADGQNAGQTVDHIRAMAKEVAGLREDAERYRWLRDDSASVNSSDWPVIVMTGDRDYRSLWLSRADAAIDAARTATASEAKP